MKQLLSKFVVVAVVFSFISFANVLATDNKADDVKKEKVSESKEKGCCMKHSKECDETMKHDGKCMDKKVSKKVEKTNSKSNKEVKTDKPSAK